MKLLIAMTLASISLNALAELKAGPGYDPYTLNCIYDADSKWQMMSEIEPDTADLGYRAIRLDGSEAGQVSTGEFKEVFIYYPGEDASVDKLAKDFSVRLGFDYSQIFTITEFIFAELPNDSYTMKYFMFNGPNGKLGAGVYSEVAGGVYKTLCESSN